MNHDRPRVFAGILLLAAALLAVGGRTASAERPADWYGGGEGYELSVDNAVKHNGKASGTVKALDDAKVFGTLTQGFRADEYRGKRLRMSAYVKSENVESKAGLWVRVDGKDKGGVAFDNMMNRPIKGTTNWTRYEVVLDVPADAEEIYFGCLLVGKGQVWVDDIAFEAVGQDVAVTDLKIQPSDRMSPLTEGLSKEPKNLDFEK